MSVNQTLTAEVHLAGRDDTHYTSHCPHLKFFGVMQTSGPVDGDVTDLKVRATSKQDSLIPLFSLQCPEKADRSVAANSESGCAVTTKNAALNKITYCLLVEIMLVSNKQLERPRFLQSISF